MAYLKDIRDTILNATNAYRWDAGLQKLGYAPALGYLGQLHTNEMYRYSFFSHINQHTKKVATLQDWLVYCNLTNEYYGLGENLARFPTEASVILPGTAGQPNKRINVDARFEPNLLGEQIVNGWCQSAGHRKNILGQDYNHMGLGLLIFTTQLQGVNIKYLLVTQILGEQKRRQYDSF